MLAHYNEERIATMIAYELIQQQQNAAPGGSRGSTVGAAGAAGAAGATSLTIAIWRGEIINLFLL